MIRRIILAATLSFLALPAVAGGIGFDLPHLTFPPTTTTSTSDGK